MTEPDLKAGLRSLRASLRQIKSLLAWRQLKQAETRPHQPPAFQISDPSETDLRNECSFFLSTSIQMHIALDDTSLSIAQKERQSIKRQLARIEQDFGSLKLHQSLRTC